MEEPGAPGGWVTCIMYFEFGGRNWSWVLPPSVMRGLSDAVVVRGVVWGMRMERAMACLRVGVNLNKSFFCLF